MDGKFNYKDMIEISHEVRAWQGGDAEFDLSICGEFVVRDSKGAIRYIQASYFPTGETIYIVSRYSAFDEEHFGEKDYIIEQYFSKKRYRKSL